MTPGPLEMEEGGKSLEVLGFRCEGKAPLPGERAPP